MDGNIYGWNWFSLRNDLQHSALRRRRLRDSSVIYESVPAHITAQLQQQLRWYSSVLDLCSVHLCFATPSRRSLSRWWSNPQKAATGSHWPDCWSDFRRRRRAVWTAMLTMRSHAFWTESMFAMSLWLLSPAQVGGSLAVDHHLHSVWTENHKPTDTAREFIGSVIFQQTRNAQMSTPLRARNILLSVMDKVNFQWLVIYTLCFKKSSPLWLSW